MVDSSHLVLAAPELVRPDWLPLRVLETAMTEKERLDKILLHLNLPEGQWVLSGSGVMELHGIERERPMGDIDIFVATRTWMNLLTDNLFSPDGWNVFTTDPDDPKRRSDPPYLYRVLDGIEVNIFHSWRKRGVGDIDVAFWLNNTEKVRGWPCIPLQFLVDWKEQTGRAKDQTDIERIKKFLNEKEAA